MDDQVNLVDTNFLITAIDSVTGTAYTVGALVRGISPTTATNDAFANAITASATPYTATLDLSSATMGAGDPVPSCRISQAPSRSVWFKVTFTSAKFVEISAAGSGFDALVEVVTGSPGAFTQAACNDDSNASYPGPSSVSFTASANVTYYVMVEDYLPG